MKKYADKLGIKWYRNKFKIQLKGCYRMEINSEAFAILILTIILSYKLNAAGIGKANALECISIL